MQGEKFILQKLEKYAAGDFYGFHMPGHKRNLNMLGERLPYEIDITEIDGFDDLHHPEGLIQEAQERAAKVFGARKSHFLVNGSTVGLLSAIFSVTNQGDEILVSRNCHKSVYHAVELRQLKAHYLYPEYDAYYGLNLSISVEDVKRALQEHEQIKAIVIVSPTYDGMVSDIEGIANLAHEYEIPLIVDEAHGAHFGFHPYFPENSNKKGADLVIQSLHKTLPSLTQTALLHVNGTIVDDDLVKKYLGIFQSSSPSYILMSSIDGCVGMLEGELKERFDHYVEMLKALKLKLQDLKWLKVPEVTGADPSKVVISTVGTSISSRDLYKILLEEYHLQMEMVAGTYVLAMTTVGDTKEGFDRLAKALKEIDQRLEFGDLPNTKNNTVTIALSEIPKGKNDMETYLPWEDSVGYVALEYAYLYPPGSPILVPGEVITKESIDKLCEYREKGFSIEGLKYDDVILTKKQ